MMNELSFAVVIPVYNGEDFILRAIESCLQQTVLPDEIIVIDDASTDSTPEKIRSLDTPLIVYRRNEQNRGPSFSRNFGMQQASSSWILFLDADDIFHPGKIEILHSYLGTNRNIRAIGHAFTRPHKKRGSKVKDSLPPLKYFRADDVLLKNRIVTPALAVASGNGIFFNEQMVYAEDHDFILRTAERFGIWFIDLPLCTLQRPSLTGGGISSDRWKMRRGEIKMYIDYCKRHKLYPAIPFFVLFSLMKHVKNMLFLPNR